MIIIINKKGFNPELTARKYYVNEHVIADHFTVDYRHTPIFVSRILAYQLPSLLQTYLPRPPLTRFVYFLEDSHETEINANSKESSVQPNLQVITVRCHLCYTFRTRNNMNVTCGHTNFIIAIPTAATSFACTKQPSSGSKYLKIIQL